MPIDPNKAKLFELGFKKATGRPSDEEDMAEQKKQKEREAKIQALQAIKSSYGK